MELSVVRIHKADAPGGRPWTRTRLVVQPERYLSQCPFILLSEEWHTPDGGFAVQPREATLAVTLVLDGAVEHSHGAGEQQLLNQGDVAFMATRGRVLHRETAGEHGAHVMRLWLSLPGPLEAAGPRCEVVRHAQAGHASLGEGSALVYAGELADSSAPVRGPWPLTLADLRLPADSQVHFALPSRERCFAFVLDGEVELGRNRVRLPRGNVAWIERGLEPDGLHRLPMRAIKHTRVLLFASPVTQAQPAAPGARSADCGKDFDKAYRALRAVQMAPRELQGTIA